VEKVQIAARCEIQSAGHFDRLTGSRRPHHWSENHDCKRIRSIAQKEIVNIEVTTDAITSERRILSLGANLSIPACLGAPNTANPAVNLGTQNIQRQGARIEHVS